MYDYIEEFGDELSSQEVLPEDKEILERIIGIAKDAFSAPKEMKPDHVHYAIEEWENFRVYLRDPAAADMIGQVIELLEQIWRTSSLSFKEAHRGKDTVRAIAQFYGISTRRSYHAGY